MPKHTERDFESAIEAGLIGASGYESRAPIAYDETLALLPDDVSGFLKDSQPAKWEALESLLGPKTATTMLESLSKELDLKGTLHVLRHGFKCYGKTFRMAWFRPNTTMNPEAAENYARKPADNHAPGCLHLGHEKTGRQEPSLHHRRDPCREWYPRRHRRTQEPADRATRRRCGTSVQGKARRARSSFHFQEARPGPLRRGSGRGMDDHPAQRQGDVLSSPSTRATIKARATRRSGGTGGPITSGTRCCRSTASWKSCNASCTSK